MSENQSISDLVQGSNSITSNYASYDGPINADISIVIDEVERKRYCLSCAIEIRNKNGYGLMDADMAVTEAKKIYAYLYEDPGKVDEEF